MSVKFFTMLHVNQLQSGHVLRANLGRNQLTSQYILDCERKPEYLEKANVSLGTLTANADDAFGMEIKLRTATCYLCCAFLFLFILYESILTSADNKQHSFGRE